jgi:hypothetical protein
MISYKILKGKEKVFSTCKYMYVEVVSVERASTRSALEKICSCGCAYQLANYRAAGCGLLSVDSPECVPV